MKWIKSHPGIIKNSLALLVVLLVSVVGIKLLTGSHAATGATISMTSSATSAAPGSNFSVTIKEDSGTDPVNAVQASLNYDSSQLQYVSLTEGTAFTTVAATNTSTLGVVRVGRGVQGNPVTGSNNVVTVNFKVLATSGSVALSFDKNYSFVVRSTDNTDVLSTVAPATYPVSGTSTASASMSLNPGSGSAAAGSSFSVTLRENSGTTSVNAVQTAINYDATKLQYVSLAEGNTFTNQAATDTSTAGRIRVARSVQSGSAGVTADNPIVTLTFKVLGNSGTTDLTIDKTQSFVVSATSGSDILGTVAGSTYTLTGASTGTGTMSIDPISGTITPGSNFTVNLYEDSGTVPVSSLQSMVKYNASQLQYVSTNEIGFFSTIVTTDIGTPGTIKIGRAIPSGQTGKTGKVAVVTLTFKVLAASGTAAITIDKTQSTLINQSSNADILGSTTGSTMTVSPLAGRSATLSMTPASGNYAVGSNVVVTIKATGAANTTSTSTPLSAVQTVINYPAAQLQYVSTDNSAEFSNAQRTNTTTAGVIDLIRSVEGGKPALLGTNTVATVTFKVIGTTGSIPLTYGTNTAVYDDSGTGTNILNLASSTAASYAITGTQPTCSANPTTPGTPTKTSTNYTTTSFSWTGSSAGANCTLTGYHVYRNGTKVADVTGTTYTDSNLTIGTAYSYTVSAYDTAGHTSTTSPAASISTKADDMAPTVPASVTAAAPDAATINLNWAASTDFPNPGGVGVAGYRIYRNGALTATYSVTSGVTYTDSNVTANTTYTYTITAYDKLGNESAPSNLVSAKTLPVVVACTANPSAPTSLTGSSTLTDASISWTASTTGTNCTLGGYRVFRNGVQVGTATTTSFTDTNLTPNTSYNYTVQAYDTNAHSSTLSTVKTIATLSDTTAPSVPASITATAVSSGQVTVAWAAATDNIAVTGYKVYRGGSLLTTTTATTRSYTDSTVQPNNNYSYTVSAIDAAGNESTRAAATPSSVHTPNATDTTAPSVPGGLKVVTLTTDSAIISWTASTDNQAVAGYHVYRGATAVVDTTTTSYTLSNLTANTAYSVTLKAFDASGNTSAASSALTFTTLKPVSTLIGDLNSDNKVDITDLSILLTHWDEVNVPVKFGDINQDGKVGVNDLSILLAHLGDAQ